MVVSASGWEDNGLSSSSSASSSPPPSWGGTQPAVLAGHNLGWQSRWQKPKIYRPWLASDLPQPAPRPRRPPLPHLLPHRGRPQRPQLRPRRRGLCVAKGKAKQSVWGMSVCLRKGGVTDCRGWHVVSISLQWFKNQHTKIIFASNRFILWFTTSSFHVFFFFCIWGVKNKHLFVLQNSGGSPRESYRLSHTLSHFPDYHPQVSPFYS